MRITTELVKGANTSQDMMVVRVFQEFMEDVTYQAVAEMSREVGRKIAAEVFKKNKKKILASVDIDLVIGEMKKQILEEIKSHAAPNNH